MPSHPHGSHEPPGTNGGHRDRIIDATLDCLVTHGVAGTSMRMVAEGAHVSLGSVTHHFVDKDALLSAALPGLRRPVGGPLPGVLRGGGFAGVGPEGDGAHADGFGGVETRHDPGQ
ncbi:TetR/AcrR family transcriptional regulator [Corynebacterium suedekumii]|nr:TetR/AcrR family transcriptional regulator [Corynebacterium suedekumii]